MGFQNQPEKKQEVYTPVPEKEEKDSGWLLLPAVILGIILLVALAIIGNKRKETALKEAQPPAQPAPAPVPAPAPRKIEDYYLS